MEIFNFITLLLCLAFLVPIVTVAISLAIFDFDADDTAWEFAALPFFMILAVGVATSCYLLISATLYYFFYSKKLLLKISIFILCVLSLTLPASNVWWINTLRAPCALCSVGALLMCVMIGVYCCCCRTTKLD